MPNLQDSDQFVTDLVTRYRGRIQMYELYNEPDSTDGFMGTMSNFVTLTQHEYNIIRSIDPGALIAAPSGGASYLDFYWASGGVKTVDLLTLHPYPDSSQYTSATYPAAEKVCCGNFLIGPFKSVFAKYGLTQPIWNSEGSWDYANGAMADQDNQAAFTARYALLHWSEGIQRMYWYAWDEPNWGTLWDSTNGEHKPAKAYRQVYNWMVGATMPSSCTWSGPTTTHMPNGTIGACPLTRPGGYQALAVWNTNGSSSYTPSSSYTRYRDLDGNTVTFTPGSSITIGFKPILFENMASPSPSPTPTPTPNPGTATVTASPTTVAPGGAETVTITNGPGNTTDWVGLYAVGAADTAYASWKYLSDTQTAPSPGLTSATLHFTMPTTPGQYEFRFWANNGYTLLGKSNTVTVSQYTVSATPVSVAPSGTLMATWSAPSRHAASDWIRLFAVGAADTDFTYPYQYTGAALSGTMTFTAPTTPGSYEFRYFLNDGYIKAAMSNTVQVAPAPTLTLSANPASINAGQSSTLTWSSTNATSCTASGGWTGTKAISGTQSVSPNTTTTYTLTCTGAGGSASQSATVTATDTTPPSTPTNLSAMAVSSTQINLQWTASTDNVGVTGYKVFRNGTQIVTPSTTSYQDTGLSPNTTYTYTVAATDAAGNTSAQSASASATTQLPPSPTPVPSPGASACSLYTPSSAIPTGYGSPYDVLTSPTTLLISAMCGVASARIDLGKGDPLQYIYNTGYLFKTGGTNWSPLPYTSTESLVAGAWYPKTATRVFGNNGTENRLKGTGELISHGTEVGEPIDGTHMHAKDVRDLPDGLAFGPEANRQIALLDIHLFGPAKPHAALLRDFLSRAGPLTDQLALKLGHAREHGQNELPAM
jgi:hypothetical protein